MFHGLLDLRLSSHDFFSQHPRFSLLLLLYFVHSTVTGLLASWPSPISLYQGRLIIWLVDNNHWLLIMRNLLLFICLVVSNSLQPLACSIPGFPIFHYFLGLAQTHVHRVGDTIQPSHPLSSPSPPAFNPSWHRGLFQ